MHSVQELHLCLFSFLAECNSVECNFIEVILAGFASSIFSVHSSAELRSIN